MLKFNIPIIGMYFIAGVLFLIMMAPPANAYPLTLDGSYIFTILEENAAYESKFGYVDVSTQNSIILFDFYDEPSDFISVDFAPGEYDFFYSVRDTGNTWIDSHIKFVDNVFYLDDGGAKNDCDYNDMTISLQTANTPIPASIFILGSGLLALIGIRKRVHYEK